MLELSQFALAGYLAFTSFCRLRKTDNNTVPAVRHAFALLATISIILAVAACVLPAHPSTVLALIGIAVVQAVTAMYWRVRVPDHYVMHREPPKRRATAVGQQDAARGGRLE